MPREESTIRLLRASRAKPPHKAGESTLRRSLYGASLEQFEQLLRAAEAVGPAAQPLPIFYALSQAGRAIVAAHGADPEIKGHGLAEDQSVSSDTHLLHRRVKRRPAKDGRDAFGAVSRAIGFTRTKDLPPARRDLGRASEHLYGSAAPLASGLAASLGAVR
jgi:hypothetical protein